MSESKAESNKSSSSVNFYPDQRPAEILDNTSPELQTKGRD